MWHDCLMPFMLHDVTNMMSWTAWICAMRWQYALCWFTNHQYTDGEEETTCVTQLGYSCLYLLQTSVCLHRHRTPVCCSCFRVTSNRHRLSVFNILCVAQIAVPGHTQEACLLMKCCLFLKCAQVSNSCDHTHQMNWGPGSNFENVVFPGPLVLVGPIANFWFVYFWY